MPYPVATQRVRSSGTFATELEFSHIDRLLSVGTFVVPARPCELRPSAQHGRLGAPPATSLKGQIRPFDSVVARRQWVVEGRSRLNHCDDLSVIRHLLQV